jgi:hypothetical protein
MTHRQHLAAFERLATEHLPSIHALGPKPQVFWILAAAKSDPLIGALTAAQIAEIGCELCNVLLSRQRVISILAEAKADGQVAPVRRDGKRYFKIMKRGEDELLGGGSGVLFVDPLKPLTSIRAVEEILSSLGGDIRICDAYIDSRTLDYIARSSKADSVKLLTENVQDSSRLRRDLLAFGREHGTPIEVRVSPSGHLHDRYILSKGGLLWIGASLKDIGKKQSMIVNLPMSFALEIGKAFERCWSSSSKFN